MAVLEEALLAKHHVVTTTQTNMSVKLHTTSMSSWKESVLAADAKKAGNASEDTRIIPRPPPFTGRLA